MADTPNLSSQEHIDKAKELVYTDAQHFRAIAHALIAIAMQNQAAEDRAKDGDFTNNPFLKIPGLMGEMGIDPSNPQQGQEGVFTALPEPIEGEEDTESVGLRSLYLRNNSGKGT